MQAIRSEPQSKQPKFGQSTSRTNLFPNATINNDRNSLYNHAKPNKVDCCSCCGYTHSDSSCPVNWNQCHIIGRHGHFAKKCRSSASASAINIGTEYKVE